jgi:hypothetical protein
MVIYKYRYDAVIEMPAGAEILSVHNQHEHVEIWAIVDPERPTVLRQFRALLTGQGVGIEPKKFLGTVLLEGGKLVAHIFEKL